MNKATATRILVRLEVENAIQFYLVLDADGSIIRTGPINIDLAASADMFSGTSSEPLFSTLMDAMPDSVLAYFGNQVEMPNDGGRMCRLTIALSGHDRQSGAEWIYWSDSQGPAADVSKFVQDSVAVTQPWYDAQLQALASASK